MEKFSEKQKKSRVVKKKVNPPVQNIAKGPEPERALASIPEQICKKKEEFPLYPENFPLDLREYDRKYAKHWQQFTPNFLSENQETVRMDIKYFGVNCGSIILRVIGEKRIGEHNTVHLQARMKSAPFYKMIYSLDDSINSFVQKENFLPVKYVLIQRESKQTVDDLQLFDRKKLMNSFWYYRKKNGEETRLESTMAVPYWIHDSYSALYFVRGLPLEVGDQYEFPVATRGKIWIIKLQVLANETISLGKQEFSAVKVKAETHFPGVLAASGDINFWFSRDLRHTPLKFSAKVKIGSIDGVLVSN